MQVLGNLIAVTLLLAAPPTGDQIPTTGDHARLSHCVVSLIDQVQVPARQAGVLKALELEDGTLVKEGLLVNAGQLLGKLDDADATARHRAAELEHKVAIAEEGKAVASVEAAKKVVEVADAEVKESEWVNKRSAGSIPETQLRRQKLTVDRADAEARVADRDVEVAGLTKDLRHAQVEVASIHLHHHHIESPLDGEVVQLYRHVGEWVTAGDPILRIVHMKRLRVEGFVDARQYLPQEIAGRPVTIEVRLPRDRVETFESTINFVSPLVEASGEYRVWAEVENRRVNGFWVLRPGLNADMAIKLSTAKVASAR